MKRYLHKSVHLEGPPLDRSCYDHDWWCHGLTLLNSSTCNRREYALVSARLLPCGTVFLGTNLPSFSSAVRVFHKPEKAAVGVLAGAGSSKEVEGEKGKGDRVPSRCDTPWTRGGIGNKHIK